MLELDCAAGCRRVLELDCTAGCRRVLELDCTAGCRRGLELDCAAGCRRVLELDCAAGCRRGRGRLRFEQRRTGCNIRLRIEQRRTIGSVHTPVKHRCARGEAFRIVRRSRAIGGIRALVEHRCVPPARGLRRRAHLRSVASGPARGRRAFVPDAHHFPEPLRHEQDRRRDQRRSAQSKRGQRDNVVYAMQTHVPCASSRLEYVTATFSRYADTVSSARARISCSCESDMAASCVWMRESSETSTD